MSPFAFQTLPIPLHPSLLVISTSSFLFHICTLMSILIMERGNLLGFFAALLFLLQPPAPFMRYLPPTPLTLHLEYIYAHPRITTTSITLAIPVLSIYISIQFNSWFTDQLAVLT